MVKISELQRGDLITDLDDDDHFMTWVGAEELVENVEANKYHGVFRHSASKIRDRLEMATKGKKVKGFEVFRCENTAIAQQAADFAIEWSTSKNDQLFTQGMAAYEEPEKAANNQPNMFPLKIPYSQDRLTHERQQKAREWDVRSMFRALRVLARADSKAPVSLKGWTCSCFATYCFQAAALKVLFKDQAIDSNLLQTIQRENSKDFLSIKSDLNLIDMALGKWTDSIRKLLPKGILVDGKAVNATVLRESLNEDNNGFKKLGNITE